MSRRRHMRAARSYTRSCRTRARRMLRSRRRRSGPRLPLQRKPAALTAPPRPALRSPRVCHPRRRRPFLLRADTRRVVRAAAIAVCSKPAIGESQDRSARCSPPCFRAAAGTAPDNCWATADERNRGEPRPGDGDWHARGAAKPIAACRWRADEKRSSRAGCRRDRIPSSASVRVRRRRPGKHKSADYAEDAAVPNGARRSARCLLLGCLRGVR